MAMLGRLSYKVCHIVYPYRLPYIVYLVIAENFRLESRLAEEGEGVSIIRHRKCKERFIRNSEKMILI